VKKGSSEFDKEKALLEQKVSFLEKALSEKTDRERESSSVWNTEKIELALEIKTISSRYEGELKNLSAFLEEEKEKSSDLESKL
jgi:hypothetical protein